MKKPVTDIPASVLARLKNISEKDQVDYNFLLIRYTQERFLARLSASRYVNKFILKGGFLLLAYDVQKARPTKDIDFLGVDIGRDKMKLTEAINEIAITDLKDGVVFLVKDIKAEVIKDLAEYDGIRITVPARIGKAKASLRVDFGFGDVVTPGPLEMSYPTLLNEDQIKVLAYSKETVVSEKFEAIVKLGTFNTRMKDFFDLGFLSGKFSFEGEELQQAIKQTFAARETSLTGAKELLESDFGEQIEFEKQWQAFKRRTRIRQEGDFRDILGTIRRFLLPLIDSEVKSETLRKRWNSSKNRWEGV